MRNGSTILTPWLIIFSTLISLVFLLPLSVQAQVPTVPVIIQEAPAQLVPALLPVCGCESSGSATAAPTQYDAAGNVLHGQINHNDIGMCQINVEPRNGNIQAATKLGYDVYTEQGNIKMANWLYMKSGTQPWLSSKACWAQ